MVLGRIFGPEEQAVMRPENCTMKNLFAKSINKDLLGGDVYHMRWR
jgi:hypothetical protein